VRRCLSMAVLLWLACCTQVALADPHLRVLAASCAACHGTNGNSVGGTPVLASLAPNYFITQMQAFRSGTLPSTVMHRHAKGLTEAEINQLAEYFAAQPRHAATIPPKAETP
jgi:sulfide dehydrogenase cytochrome subunit